MSSPIDAIKSEPIHNHILTRLDQAHQAITEALSVESGISIGELEDFILQLQALSEHDRKHIDSVLKRVFGDERTKQAGAYVGCLNEKTIFILTTIAAIAQVSATTGMLAPAFRTGTVDLTNWTTSRGINLLTLGKCAGRTFLHLPVDPDKASEAFQKVFGTVSQVTEMLKGIPAANNEGRKFEHQSHKDAAERSEQSMSTDISQESSRRDEFIRMIQQKRQQLHEAILSLMRS